MPLFSYFYLNTILKVLNFGSKTEAVSPQSDYQEAPSRKIVGNSRQVGSLCFIHLLLTFFAYFYSRLIFGDKNFGILEREKYSNFGFFYFFLHGHSMHSDHTHSVELQALQSCRTFSHSQQGRIDFNTVTPLSCPQEWISRSTPE